MTLIFDLLIPKLTSSLLSQDANVWRKSIIHRYHGHTDGRHKNVPQCLSHRQKVTDEQYTSTQAVHEQNKVARKFLAYLKVVFTASVWRNVFRDVTAEDGQCEHRRETCRTFRAGYVYFHILCTQASAASVEQPDNSCFASSLNASKIILNNN